MTARARRGIIFCDLDGTLCFHEALHGVRVVGRDPDGSPRVTAPGSDRVHSAHDLSTGDYRVYMSEETRRLCHHLRADYEFVILTGARLLTVEARHRFLDFADALVIESGGGVLDAELRPDPEWAARVAESRAALDQAARRLERDGWTLDVAGRRLAIRVRLVDNRHRSERELAGLPERLPLPAGLRATWNLGHLDIIPELAGKENAAAYLMRRRGYRPEESVGIGDDLNDLGFLRLVGSAHVLASAFPEVLLAAREEGWAVSAGPHFEGIHEILRRIASLPPP